jgi:hypothetical protein
MRVTLSDSELGYLSHILWHFTDYMAGDDRQDHGFGILKGYRDSSEETKRELYLLAGRLRRYENKQRGKI